MPPRGTGTRSDTSGTSIKEKSPANSSQLASKPDKDKDDKDKKPGSMSERSSVKAGKINARQFLSKKELQMLKKAKKAGGKAWEEARAKIRLKLTPPEHKSKSARANTAMPVNKLKRRMQQAVPRNCRISTEASIALAAVLDYAVSELIDNACQAADLKKQKTITPRHIKLGVPQDESLAELFKGVTIPQGGTVPTFHPELAQGYRKRKAPQRQDYEKFDKELKETSSPSVGGKKGGTENSMKNKSDDETSIDPKKDKPGASSSSPAEK